MNKFLSLAFLLGSLLFAGDWEMYQGFLADKKEDYKKAYQILIKNVKKEIHKLVAFLKYMIKTREEKVWVFIEKLVIRGILGDVYSLVKYIWKAKKSNKMVIRQ